MMKQSNNEQVQSVQEPPKNNNEQGSLVLISSNVAGQAEQMRLDRQKVTPTWSTRLSRLMVQNGIWDVQQNFKDTQAGKGLETVREGFTAEKGYYGKLLETIIEMEYHFGHVQKNASMVRKNGVRKFSSVVEQLVLIKEQQAKAVSMIREALLTEINGKGPLKRPARYLPLRAHQELSTWLKRRARTLD